MLTRLFPRRAAPLRQSGKSNQPHMINTWRGFVNDIGNEIRFTSDSRMASVYPTFEAADAFAKDVVMPMLLAQAKAEGRNIHKQYFAILITA
jgi:hypothetical protein